jgi:primosomal protein N' (replication factor Y) (superfamily II helicase)
LARATGQGTGRVARGQEHVRVALMIPTHALPPLSYGVPAHLRSDVRPGTVVVAPLSGRSRLGVVVGPDPQQGRAREEISSVHHKLSLPQDLLEACLRVSESYAVPLPTVLRASLPPGLDTRSFQVVRPDTEWPWPAGTVVSRAEIKKGLGADGLRAAEAGGLVSLSPTVPNRKTVEWSVVRGATEPDLARAPRQRAVFGALNDRGGALPSASLLSETGAGRNVLRELVRRGAVKLVHRPEPAPLFETSGGGEEGDGPFRRDAGRAVGRGGAFVWRVPTGGQPDAVAALARAAVEEGEQALILVPERETVDRMVLHIRRALPPGHTVAAYHGGIGRHRAEVHAAARDGGADVVVGTRAAALLPLARPGAFCVVDEPNGSHRAEAWYEGLPVHTRDVAAARGRSEGAAIVCLSPVPSLRLYAAEGRAKVRELPARPPAGWPSVRIVDMRGSGSVLSSKVLDACSRFADGGRRVGVLVDRLGYAAVVACNRCGAVTRCQGCHVPLSAHEERSRVLVCNRCGRREPSRCDECGSGRFSPVGLAVERVRDALSEALGVPVGLITAGRRELDDAAVVAGTARCVLREGWDVVLIPDVDSSLQASSLAATERSFRLVYRAAEVAARMLLIQTRTPEHHALLAAARGDYEALVAAEVPRLRAAGYPPFAHLAVASLHGREETVLRAVESRLRPALEAGVEASEPVGVARAGGPLFWKVLIRARDLGAVGRAAALIARLAAGTPGLQARVEVDPEEV